MLESLAFKGIVEVRVESPKKQDRAGDQVQGYQQWPPTLVLPDMNVLMVSASVQALLVAAKNDMARAPALRAPARLGAPCAPALPPIP